MSQQAVRWALVVASRIADELSASLAPYCERIEMAGSIRRRKADVGDIELVLIPKMLEQARREQRDLFAPATLEHVNLAWAHLDRLVEAGRLPLPIKSGQRYRCYPAVTLPGRVDRIEDPSSPVWPMDGGRWFDARPEDLPAYVSLPQVDIFAVLPPAQWGPLLAIRTGPATFGKSCMSRLISRGLRMEDGQVLVRGSGERVDCPEEEDFLRACGLPWVAPEERR